MSRYRTTFFRGLFAGFLVGTLLLIASSLVFKGVSLSFYEREANREILAEGRSLLSLEVLPSPLASESREVVTSAVGVSLEKEAGASETPGESTGDEIEEPKKPLLVVVTTTRVLLERTCNKIRTSWGGGGTTDYRIVVGRGDATEDISSDPKVVESDHHSFPALPYLSIKDLVALLNLVTSNFLHQYNWFLIGPSNVYVSVQRLEWLLSGLNPYKVLYIGRPSNTSMPKGHCYCEGGPGIVFSHMALKKMKGVLQRCVQDSKGDLGYRELGLCMMSELQTQCYMRNQEFLRSHFLHDIDQVSLNHNELLRNKSYFQHMVTLYPIHDQQHLNIIHTFNQAREIALLEEKARDAEMKLRSNPFCVESPSDCKLTLSPLPINKSLKSLTGHCQFLSRGYIPEMRRKIVHWDTITGHTVYDSWNLSPQELVHGSLSRELKYITDAAVNVALKDAPGMQLVDVVNVYVRYRGTVGREFMLDLEFNGSGGDVLEKRVSLLLPHTKDFSLKISRVESRGSLTRVNFIIPLNGLNRKKTAKFQRNFYTMCVRRTENCRVIYIMYSSSNSDVNFMKTYLSRFKRRHSKFSYEYVIGKGKFNRTEAYELGLAKLNGSELAFIASVDISLADHFLTRCRAHSRLGYQLYYPELFMYYNMPYVYRGKWHPRNYDYSRLHGRWATRAIVCIHKADYMRLGGYSTLQRWEVDPGAVTASLPGKMKVFKAPDPGISHWYEATQCDSKLPPDQFSRCLSTRSDNLADRLSLAGYLLSLESKCSNK